MFAVESVAQDVEACDGEAGGRADENIRGKVRAGIHARKTDSSSKRIRDDSYGQGTGLLAGEAVLDAAGQRRPSSTGKCSRSRPRSPRGRSRCADIPPPPRPKGLA